jgi:hypothetical protein
VDDAQIILKYTMELEYSYVDVWARGYVLEKSGSAFYSGGKKIQL